MRILLLVASVLLLCGCSDGDWAHVMSSVSGSTLLTYPDAPAAEAPAPVARAVPPAREKVCAAAASSRSEAADAQGFDEEMQRVVYDRAYADCIGRMARAPR